MTAKGFFGDGAGPRIVVCLKQVRHRYARTGLDPERKYLAPEDEVLLINPHDEAALNLAVEMKSQIGGKVAALVLGSIFAQEDLQRCLALGADVFVNVEGCVAEDTWSKSLAIAEALRRLSPTLVLCGLESLDGKNGQMGAFLARHLDLPFVSAIQKVDLDLGSRTARIQRAAGLGEREIVSSSLPAVLSVDAGAASMKLATIAGRRKAGDMVYRQFMLQGDLEKPMQRILEEIPPRPRCNAKDAPSPKLGWYERVENLLSGSSVDKQVRLLQGEPDRIAEDIVEFLVEMDILEPTPSEGPTKNS